MAASEDNIEIIERASRQLIEKLYPLREDFFSSNPQKKKFAQENVQKKVNEYHTLLLSIELDNLDKFKLAVDALETAWGEKQEKEWDYQFTFHMLCTMIQDAEQELNKTLLATALRQKASQILINLLRDYNGFFFTSDDDDKARWIGAINLEDYYSVCPKKQDFAEAVNLFRSLSEEEKSKCCAMVYYFDQEKARSGNMSLSAELISQGLITQEQMEKSLRTSSGSYADSGQNQSSQDFSDKKENNETGCWPAIPEIPHLSTVINDMSPQAQLGTAFCMFAMGALEITAGVLLALVLVHSVIPSFGATAPIAIGGCVAAAVGIVSGVALMGASIKVAQNAFTLFPCFDSVEKPSSTQDRHCLNYLLF